MTQLQEFITKNKEQSLESIRCGSCGNSLIHCGKYTIEKVGMGKGKKSEEGVLCETCQKHNRKIRSITKIFDNKDGSQTVTNSRVADLDINVQKEALEEEAEFKKIEAESIKSQIKTAATVEAAKEQKSEDNNKKKD